jgi:hypothetical protein
MDIGEVSVHCLQHHQTFPPKLGALGAGKAMDGAFKMLTQDPDTLKVWVWLQQWDIAPNEGSNFIVGDGSINVLFDCHISCGKTVQWIEEAPAGSFLDCTWCGAN